MPQHDEHSNLTTTIFFILPFVLMLGNSPVYGDIMGYKVLNGKPRYRQRHFPVY